MQRLVFIVAYPFLWFIAILPFPLLYLMSDLAFLILFYLVRYRRKVVRDNLNLALDGYNKKQLKTIERSFYRHFCDLFLESLKTLTMSRDELFKRYELINTEVIHQLESQRSVLVMIPHYGNWEWSVVVNTYIRTKGYAVYQKLGNRYFDKMFRKIRARFNNTPIHQKQMIRTLIRNLEQDEHAVYGIVSDQSPQVHRTKYWRPFMGTTVPVFDSPEILARKFDLAVVYGRISKLKRGHYQLEFVPITERGATTDEHFITDKFIELTEENIRSNPAYYLWTHRRWKHRDRVPPEFR